MRLSTKEQLYSELDNLKKLADEQTHHYQSSRKLLHEGLSRLYLLWNSANKQKGMLEQLYKEHGIQYKREILAQVNFSPLLRYVWDMDGTYNSNTIDQWNRALNKIHIHFIGNKEFYKSSALTKLIAFISTNGGVTALAAYSSSFAEEDTKSRRKKVDVNLEKKRLSRHVEKGREFFSKSASMLASFQSTTTLPTADGDLAVALIKKSRRGYDLISIVDDKELLESVVVHAYKRDNSDVPYPLRFILETLRTQLPPHYIRSLNRSLNEPSKSKDEHGKTIQRLRRLLFMSKERVFLLSATRGTCSPVTIAYPKQILIESTEDAYLAQNDRSFIEDEIIFSGDENLVTTDCQKQFLLAQKEVASHKMYIKHSVTNRSRFVRFYPISTYKSEEAKPQAILRKGIKIPTHYAVTVNAIWIKELNGRYLSRWINGFGKAIKRKEYAVQRIVFGKTGITFQFIQRGGSYDDSETIPFLTHANTKPITVEVLSKDIIPILNFIAQTDVVGPVHINVCSHLIRFNVKTTTASYLIAVPTCSHAGKRDDSLFQLYGGTQ